YTLGWRGKNSEGQCSHSSDCAFGEFQNGAGSPVARAAKVREAARTKLIARRPPRMSTFYIRTSGAITPGKSRIDVSSTSGRAARIRRALGNGPITPMDRT